MYPLQVGKLLLMIMLIPVFVYGIVDVFLTL